MYWTFAADREYRKVLAMIMPLSIVGWIGFPRFAKPDIELIATSLGLWLGGIALLWRLDTVAKTPAERNGGSIVGTAMLMALLLAFAPVAFLGGSSTSLMLCLAAVAALPQSRCGRFPFREAIWGQRRLWCRVRASCDDRHRNIDHGEVDLVALALLLLIPYAGEVSARFLLPQNRFRGRVRQVLVGIFAASPILLVMAVLVLRHPKSFVMRSEPCVEPLPPVSAIAALLVSATVSQAADYTIDPTHSHILFMIDHLGFAKMVGLFSDFSGNISFDANNVPASKLNVTIKTDSLQTHFAPRDKDLKGADWFNVTEFPEMTFVGTKFVKKDDHTGTITESSPCMA